MARRGHPLGGAVRLAELSHAAWVVGSNTDERHAIVEEVFMAAGLAKPRIMVKADSIIQVRTLIASTDLIGLLPRALFVGLSGRPIDPLPIEDMLRPARVCLTTRVGASLPDEAHAFLGMIRAQARIIARSLASDRSAAGASVPAQVSA